MISNYGIFNNHELDNTLLVKLFDDEVTEVKKLSDEMELLYHNTKLVSYRIKNFLRYAKIKYSGIIFLPNNPLIDVINSILSKYNLENLEYKKGSGYITRVNDGVMQVYATEGTFLRDGTISKGRFCTYYDLYIDHEDEHSLIVINEYIKEGRDFFLTEAI